MNSRNIAYAGIYIALMAILSFVPYTGYIKIGTINFTIIPVVLVIAAYHIGGFGIMVTSMSFGIFSYLSSITLTPSPLADPLVLMVSRFLVGLSVYGVYKMIRKINIFKVVILTLSTFILNTLLLSSFLFLVINLGYNDIVNVFKGMSVYAWLVIIWLNFTVEVSFGIGMSIFLYPMIKYLSSTYDQSKKNSWT